MSDMVSRRALLGRSAVAAATVSATGSLAVLVAACRGSSSDDTAADSSGVRNDSALTRVPWRGTVVQAEDGELLVSTRRRVPMRIKIDSRVATGATMSMIVSPVDPGASIPVHLHRNEDELIFIHTGAGIVTLGDDRVPVAAGAVLYAPKNVWHGVENTGSVPITWCAVYSPPGFERFFRETGVVPGDGREPPPPGEVMAIARRYGMIFRDS